MAGGGIWFSEKLWNQQTYQRSLFNCHDCRRNTTAAFISPSSLFWGKVSSSAIDYVSLAPLFYSCLRRKYSLVVIADFANKKSCSCSKWVRGLKGSRHNKSRLYLFHFKIRNAIIKAWELQEDLFPPQALAVNSIHYRAINLPNHHNSLRS